jgi:trehalose 6-phosphate phosphatase
MKHILADAHRELLRQFARSNLLIALDYDGTLAPIVTDPERAALGATTRRVLAEVTKLYRCVIISGRSRADVLARIDGLGVHGVVGNHGIEPHQAGVDLTGRVREWHPILEQRLLSIRGVMIENKTHSLSVHYRRSRQKKAARAAILDVAATLEDVRLIGGKQVVNIVPQGAPHKGIALERERERLGCDTAIFVGDDVTDEDVFALVQPGRLLSIRIGKSARSSALYYLRNQAEIDELLKVLLDLRVASGS